MASSDEQHEIVYLTKVSKIPEWNAPALQEVGLRLQVFDRVLEVVSIQKRICMLTGIFLLGLQPCGRHTSTHHGKIKHFFCV